jgi:hypothetical protein
MDVKIDESGCHHPPGDIDDLGGFAGLDVAAHRFDLAIDDVEIGDPVRAA